METVLKVLHLNISFSSTHYYFIDCPLPRSCKDWYDLGIMKNCYYYYPTYPDRDTQQLVTIVYKTLLRTYLVMYHNSMIILCLNITYLGLL